MSLPRDADLNIDMVVMARRIAPRLWDPIARALAISGVTGLVASHLDD